MNLDWSLFGGFGQGFISKNEFRIILPAVLIIVIISLLISWLKRSNNPVLGVLRFLRNVLIPTLVVLALCLLVYEVPRSSHSLKLLETLLGIELIWLVLSLFKVIFFHHPATSKLRTSVPGLFIDLVRLTLVVVGSALVIASVWQKDLSSFLATLGIGSIVIGLALQDTLGNLFSGIALLFEKPFTLGDWVQIGDTVGEVIGTNWRAVRLRTRDLDMVVVPNTALTKERIKNYSRPTLEHREIMTMGFSYQDSPHKVREAMLEVLRSTPGVLSHPPPKVRTKSYQDFSIQYELLFYTDDFRAVQDTGADIMTRVWYSARRHGLTIPFPIRTVYKTELPAEVKSEPYAETADLLRRVPLLSPLTDKEVEWLAIRVDSHTYSDNEYVVKQGDVGSSLYIVQSGSAAVSLKDAKYGNETEVSQLGPGDFFGERSFLTGEPRSASIIAQGELNVVIFKSKLLQDLLEKRPELAEQIAEIIKSRDEELQKVSESSQIRGNVLEPNSEKRSQLLSRLKNIFGRAS